MKSLFTQKKLPKNELFQKLQLFIYFFSDPAANIDEEKFKEIMRYIIGLIDKDKHLESLVEKLCHRFHATSTERQWRDLAFCLSLFAYNEKAAKKFIDSFSCFSDKLHEDFVHEAVQNIMTQCKKLPKQETKMAIDELALKVEGWFTVHSGPENFKKIPAKKLVKSNKSISRNFILTKFHFLQFQKWPKINF